MSLRAPVAFLDVCGGISRHLAVFVWDSTSSSWDLMSMSFKVHRIRCTSAGKDVTVSR